MVNQRSPRFPAYLRHDQQILTLFEYVLRRKMWQAAAGVIADTCVKVVALEKQEQEQQQQETPDKTKQRSEEWLKLVETIHRMMWAGRVPFTGEGMMNEYTNSDRGIFLDWLADWIERRGND